MSVVWTNELELLFLDHLLVEPVLWNRYTLDFKNKLKSNDAWNRISALMKIPTVDLRNKKDSLFASYRSYRNKVRKSVNSGADSDDVYKPKWFAYELMDTYFGDTKICKEEIDACYVCTPSDESNSPQGSPSNNREQECYPLRKKKKIQVSGLDCGEECTCEGPSRRDECDTIGQLVAYKLRKLNRRNRLIAERRINDILINLELQELDTSSSEIITCKLQTTTKDKSNEC